MSLSTESSQYIPPELLDHIFSYLTVLRNGTCENDAKHLYNACLASRQLYEIALPQLYATIRLDISSHQVKLLLRTLQEKPHLALAVKEVSIECTTDYYALALQSFLQELIDRMHNVVLLRNDRRSCTTRFINTVLYKKGGGYSMGVPTDLNNLRSLELFAEDLVFKYNYILRLPQLQRVCLNATAVVDYHQEDMTWPDNWGWTSYSIKELILRPCIRSMVDRRWDIPLLLRSNSLTALSRCMPALEALTIEHFNPENHHKIGFRVLAIFFVPQLSGSLRRLEIRDGCLNPTDVGSGLTPLLNPQDSKAIFEGIGASALTHLAIDLGTFRHGNVCEDLFDLAMGSMPTLLRRLTLHYDDTSSTGIIASILEWDIKIVVQQVRCRCPKLTEIDLDLRINGGSKIDRPILQQYKEEFQAVGINFHIPEHKYSPPNNRSINHTNYMLRIPTDFIHSTPTSLALTLPRAL
ncbi:hypothetical protein P280DRAFT_226144 [Massarina eburnea CBS 473.64]|uniref:Uncharacterized protein n=1 Tax=Massarina eburnea CBS 473.64 TaxID=1395130 RepID=A0A6A6S9A4_9PLEO|nr:hypothetical protein P280DRAFT_226144 [Massarina eburnea CBS 473.64]